MAKPESRREDQSFKRASGKHRAKEALVTPYIAEEDSDANDPDSFRSELTALINKHSLEGGSNTADYILADYLSRCLENFDLTLQVRSKQTTPDPKDDI